MSGRISPLTALDHSLTQKRCET